MKSWMEQGLEALPHGPEFRFVHKLLALNPGQTAKGEYVLPESADFLKGHFPGEPIMPGVLLVEAVAQLGGIAAQMDPHVSPLKKVRLAGIRNAKILGTARPGETVELEVNLLGRMGGMIQVSGSASVAGRTILRCEVTLAGEVE